MVKKCTTCVKRLHIHSFETGQIPWLNFWKGVKRIPSSTLTSWMATDLWPMMSLHMMMCSNSISWNVDSKGCVSNTAAHNAFAVYSGTHCLELAYKIKMKWSSPLGFTYFKLFVTDTNSTHLILFRSFLLKQRWTTDHCTFSFLVWDVNTVTCMYGWDGGGWGGCTCLCVCAFVFSGALRPQKPGLLRTGSPVQPPQLSHSSCAVHVPVVYFISDMNR